MVDIFEFRVRVGVGHTVHVRFFWPKVRSVACAYDMDCKMILISYSNSSAPLPPHASYPIIKSKRKKKKNKKLKNYANNPFCHQLHLSFATGSLNCVIPVTFKFCTVASYP
jgi:hypothetical protein